MSENVQVVAEKVITSGGESDDSVSFVTAALLRVVQVVGLIVRVSQGSERVNPE